MELSFRYTPFIAQTPQSTTFTVLCAVVRIFATVTAYVFE